MNRHDLALVISEAQRALRATDAAAFLVPTRVMRRVIMRHRDLVGLIFRVPHRKSYVISGEQLAQIVDRDELGLGPDEPYPHTAILIVRPDEKELGTIPLPEFMGQIWRLLFHARIHVAFEELRRTRNLTHRDFRERIDRLGQVEFDEIQHVLRRENYLFASQFDPGDIYIEFAAVYLEARQFSPHWLPVYFPLLAGRDDVVDLLAGDVDFRAIYEACRPAHAVLPAAPTATPLDEEPDAAQPGGGQKPHDRRYRAWIAWAERAMSRGNSVAAAIGFLRAAQYGQPEQASESVSRSRKSIDKLVRRLQAALGFDDEAARQWRQSLQALLTHSTRGFWNHDKRLLYDLQNVCIDHERVVYTVDVGKWLASFGRRPIKRPLPNQREVLMSKHLRRAASRLVSARLSGQERERLENLLNEAARLAEQQMRTHLRPLVRQMMETVGMTPRNVPERVSANKLVEELLDGVARRGYLTMGNFRDTVSRNNLKVPDLASPREIVTGDQLLRADRQLDVLLDGVYHRGEFYLRALQILSSLAFGTGIGRLLTRFVAIPFGGAYMVLEFLKHVFGYIVELPDELSGWLGKVVFQINLPRLILDGPIPFTQARLLNIGAVTVLGLFVLGLIHVRWFRRLVVSVLRGLYHLLRGVLYDLPTWLVRRTWVRAIWRSRPVVMLRRFVVKPGLLTVFFGVVVPAVASYKPPTFSLQIAMFLTFNLLLNSRIGRDFEEVTAEWIARTWYRIRVHIIVAMFELIMDTFKRLLEAVERVLYAVDEWLRFKSGESHVALVVKAVLGLVWSVVNFVVRFVVTLLIEPQINPIKHFPVVTVSHKFILPLGIPNGPLSKALQSVGLETVEANTLAGTIVFLIPGIFGFLVWELKENWRLYEANRIKRLKPVLVGEHGETLPRLLKPGFHSGTLPKLFAKLRRATRELAPVQYRNRLHERLHHVEIDVRRFVEREFVGLLAESRDWQGLSLRVGEVRATSDCLFVAIHGPDSGRTSEPWRLLFQERSGWLLATTIDHGFLRQLDERRRQTLTTALLGFYKLGGVDLVREQLAHCFAPNLPRFDITENYLLVQDPDGEAESVRYSLTHHGRVRPEGLTFAKSHGVPTLDSSAFLFAETTISWSNWVAVWDGRPSTNLPQAVIL